MKKILALLVLASMILSLTTVEAKKFGDNYRLEKVLIMSRHNIRSPYPERAQKLTPHKFFKWTSNPRELSLRGGVVETELGQYFRKYLVDEDFMTENYLPATGEFRFLANSYQRTVATAQYFSSGMLPVANVEVERRFKIGEWDPVFDMRIKFMNEKLQKAIEKDLTDYCGGNIGVLNEDLSQNLALLEKVLDFKDSQYSNKVNFRANDVKVIFEENKELKLRGSFSEAVPAADALVLQYYEEPSDKKASFGHKLSDKQWKQIADILNFNNGVVGTPTLSIITAHPLLECMHSELTNDRRFTFLCGHDTNIVGLLGALRVEEYTLPDAIETHTPIGVKFVIEKWRGLDGETYATLNLVYATPAQIRNLEPLTLDNPPKIYPLRLKGLQTNADGLYLFSDVEKRFAEAIQEYNSFVE